MTEEVKNLSQKRLQARFKRRDMTGTDARWLLSMFYSLFPKVISNEAQWQLFL